MKNKIENFDLIFIIGYFRNALPLLSVAKYLKEYKVGMFFAPLENDSEKKIKNYQNRFKDLMLKEGVLECNLEKIHKTKILIVQQYVYNHNFLASLSKFLKYDKTIALLGYRMGFGGNDLFFEYFRIDLCAINDINLFNLFVKKRNCNKIYRKYDVVEVGLPFLKYPPFQIPKIDWIIASPTTFSFENEYELNNYLKSVISLIEQIDSDELIVYKPHNGNEIDYLEGIYGKLSKFIPIKKKIKGFIEFTIRRLPYIFAKYFCKLLSAYLQKSILERAVLLSEISDKHFLSIEAFIPNVKNGVIGGNSNTIWGTRFYKKKYLNCSQNKTNNKDITFKKADKTINLNLSYFGVPYCENNINFNKVKNKISNVDEIKLNLVDLVKKQLEN